MAMRVEKPSTEKPRPPLTAVKLDSQAHPTRGGGFDPARRGSMIAEAAYYRAEHRAFAPGRELEDWFAAEAEVDAWLARGVAP
jgi:hypothetical protein